MGQLAFFMATGFITFGIWFFLFHKEFKRLRVAFQRNTRATKKFNEAQRQKWKELTDYAKEISEAHSKRLESQNAKIDEANKNIAALLIRYKPPETVEQTPTKTEKPFWDNPAALENFLTPEEKAAETFEELLTTNPLEAHRLAAVRLEELNEERPR